MAAVLTHLRGLLLTAENEAERCDRLRHIGPAHHDGAEFWAGRASGLRSALEALELLTSETKGSNA
jgi:hypothetical protein